MLEYCDIHSHLLPGVDDGCQTELESLECLTALIAQGCRTVVCSPHMGLDRYASNTPNAIGEKVRDLQALADGAQLPIRILQGGEFRLVEHAVQWWLAEGVPCLGEGKAVLVDTWATEWLDYCDASIDWLLTQGYQPILAHPERMRFENERQWHDLLEDLKQRGVLLQGNFKSFASSEHEIVRQRAENLLQAGEYDLLASDTHGPASLAPRADGWQRLQDLLDESQLLELAATKPSELLEIPFPLESSP